MVQKFLVQKFMDKKFNGCLQNTLAACFAFAVNLDVYGTTSFSWMCMMFLTIGLTTTSWRRRMFLEFVRSLYAFTSMEMDNSLSVNG